MDPHLAPNDAQRRNWNEVSGPKWIRYEALQEAWLRPVADLLLAAATPGAGERVLEIGCGAGTLLGDLAKAVGPTGSVTGIDISATMLDLARGRAPAGVTLMEADAQTAPLGGPYDVMLSRFGVMFFDDPVTAFTNLHNALHPDGRLSFVCWGPLEENPLWRDALAIATRHLGPVGPRDPLAPGPLAFADPARVRSLLTTAGFARIALRTTHLMLTVADATIAGELTTRMGPAGALISERNASAETIAAITAEIVDTWRPTPACLHVVTAHP